MQKTQGNSNDQETATALSTTAVEREHWIPALLRGRKPTTFRITGNAERSYISGYGISARGLPSLAARSVALGDVGWWLRVVGLATLQITIREDTRLKVVEVFLGRRARVEALASAIHHQIDQDLVKLGVRLDVRLTGLETDHSQLFSPERFVRHSELVGFMARHANFDDKTWKYEAWAWLDHPLHAPDPKREPMNSRIRWAKDFLKAPEKARQVHNAAFVTEQRKKYAPYFSTVESSPLTPEQIEASLLFEDANVTVAAAGSGKTSVMVSKVGFALQAGLFRPEEVIVLAYNKDAAKELRDRISASLEKFIKGKVSIEARTFHSLGLAIWMRGQRIKGLPSRPRLIDFQASEKKTDAETEFGKGTWKGKRLLRDVLLELAGNKKDSSFATAVMQWANAHRFPIPELDACDDETLQERQVRYERMCRKLARRKGVEPYEPQIPTFDPNLWVRSTEEARLCNWLLLRKVEFWYERAAPGWLAGKVNEKLPKEDALRAYLPDFTYPNPKEPTKKFFHEHFGLDQKGHAPAFMGRPYEERARLKRAALTAALGSRTKGEPSRFFETSSGQFSDGSIFTRLEQELQLRGISIGKPDRDVWSRALTTFLNDESVIDLIANFVTKLRDSGLTTEEVEARMSNLPGANRDRAKSFMIWMKPLIKRLEERLTQGTMGGTPRQLLDFSGMIAGAVDALKTWSAGTLPYKLVLVDEFQDISRLRAKFVQGLLDQHSEASVLYCVGDDWQSINRFAGSDVHIFRSVYDGLKAEQSGAPVSGRFSAQSLLGKTFRCPQGIADVARWFVMKGDLKNELIDKPVESGKPDKAGVIRVVEHGDSADARWAAIESEMERIAKVMAESGEAAADVFILTRNRQDTSLPKGVDSERLAQLGSQFASRGLNVVHHSMHGSKGLGAQYVVLVGLDSGSAGFPIDRFEEPLIEVLLPPRRSFIDEERRLFYVAITRAKKELTILCVGNRPSIFVHELEQYPEPGVVDVTPLAGVVRHLCPRCKQSWLRRQSRPGRVECMRSPMCAFAGSDRTFPNLPANPFQAA